jgi:hypothetical protein
MGHTNLFLQLHLDAIQSCFTLIHPLSLFPRPDQFFRENTCISNVLGAFFGHLLDHPSGLLFLFSERVDLTVKHALLPADVGLPFP